MRPADRFSEISPDIYLARHIGVKNGWSLNVGKSSEASQRSLHNEPIFRLLLKVAVRERGALMRISEFLRAFGSTLIFQSLLQRCCNMQHFVSGSYEGIVLAEGAIARSMTPCGGVLFAS